MFEIYLTNFGYCLQDRPKSLEEAKSAARKAGFESRISEIMEDDERVPVALYSPIYGFKTLTNNRDRTEELELEEIGRDDMLEATIRGL